MAALGTARRRVNPAASPASPLTPPAEMPSREEMMVPAFSLSREEQIKRALHPLDAFPRLLECVRENRPPDEEDQFRFRWFGLFYQGPQQDAFRLRLRLPGGRLQAFQLTGLAEITQRLAGGCVLLNEVGGVDLPGVPLAGAANILRQVEGIGLSARQTGGDCVQAVRGGEHEGLRGDDPPAIIYPLVCELEQVLASSRLLSNLPEGCEIVFHRSGDDSVRAGGPRSQIVVRQTGSPPAHSTSWPPEPAQPVPFLLSVPGCVDGGFALTAAQVVPACAGLLRLWAERGNRTDRQHASLAEHCAGLDRESLGNLLGKLPWKQGMTAAEKTRVSAEGKPVGLAPPGKRLLSGQLVRLAKVMEAQGLSELRVADRHLFFAPTTDDAATTQDLVEALTDS